MKAMILMILCFSTQAQAYACYTEVCREFLGNVVALERMANDTQNSERLKSRIIGLYTRVCNVHNLYRRILQESVRRFENGYLEADRIGWNNTAGERHKRTVYAYKIDGRLEFAASYSELQGQAQYVTDFQFVLNQWEQRVLNRSQIEAANCGDIEKPLPQTHAYARNEVEQIYATLGLPRVPIQPPPRGLPPVSNPRSFQSGTS